VLVLLWMWRAAMESFSAANGLCDPAMKPLVLPVAQLAVGGGCKQRMKRDQLEQAYIYLQAQHRGSGCDHSGTVHCTLYGADEWAAHKSTAVQCLNITPHGSVTCSNPLMLLLCCCCPQCYAAGQDHQQQLLIAAVQLRRPLMQLSMCQFCSLRVRQT
jgi:hypothetical protein